jgi:thiol-disulfide isomerase/thioredoxin
LNRNSVILAIIVVVVGLMLFGGQIFSKKSAGPAVTASGKLTGGNVTGAQSPEFELKTLDGKTLKLSDLRGQAVLLNFWATWCTPCKVEMPWFVEFQKEYGPQGFTVVGVALDDSGENVVAEFAKEMKVNYPIVMGTDAVGDAYAVQGLPITFYIGRDGVIQDRSIGLVSRAEIEEHIKKAVAGAPGSAR